MNTEIEYHIRHNNAWSKLPANVKQSIGNVQREYEKLVVQFSIKNQLRYKGNLVKTIVKDERKYYEDLLKYSREHLMLYPYHLSDVIVKGLRVTPFSYYVTIMADIMTQEKSYDSLPNFTAADCLRLMAIGRNQYIDIMNQCRSSKKFFRRRPVKELLPAQPVDTVVLEPWWIVQTGYIVEEDIKMCSVSEKKAIDQIIDNGPRAAGEMDFSVLHGLYRKGLVYMDVPIADTDYIVVPPLEGFVMNRVLGDYFETLLYKIFVSIDERTTIAELANILEIDLQLVKNAVSVFCRLGFAKKKLPPSDASGNDLYHESWRNVEQQNILTKKPTQDQLLIDWTATINDLASPTNQATSPDGASLAETSEPMNLLFTGHVKRIAFLFDSTLTAFLMMGNLSPGLKSHAVTMFEVGKLNDECLDSFLAELEKVDTIAEGEAQRYFDHAITLRDTIRFLRYNRDLVSDQEAGGPVASAGQGVDLLRCESLLGLDTATCTRVLNKNYTLLVSVAPLSNEIRPVSSSTPPHLGPAIPEVNSVWFKLYIYYLTGSGPPSLLLVKGTRLRCLPRVFREYDRLLVTTWGHDPAIISTSNILLTLNDALSHSALLVQGHGWCSHEGQVVHVPFPFHQNEDGGDSASEAELLVRRLSRHSAVGDLDAAIDLRHTCGYVTMLRTGTRHQRILTTNGVGDNVYRGGNDVFDKLSVGEMSTESGADTTSLASPIDPAEPVAAAEKTSTSDGDSLNIYGVSTEAKTEDDNASTNSDDELWVLLDCNFGVPLFDAEVNRLVCRRISKHGLCNQRSLQELVASNRKLAADLVSFVSNYQSASPAAPGFDESSDSASSSVASSVPLPMQNLLFNNGTLSAWDGH